MSGGTLGISADGNLGGPTSSVSLNNGTLLVGGSGSFTLASGRAISLTGSSAIDVVSGQSVTLAGVVSGGTLTKTDNGTLSLTNAGNNYSGGTVINGGILAASDSSLGAPAAASRSTTVHSRSGSGPSNRDLTLGNGFPALQVASGTCTENGLISGSNALAKTGPGTLLLTNASNSFSTLNLEAGTLLVPGGLTLSRQLLSAAARCPAAGLSCSRRRCIPAI